jgi:RNA polymerase sigma factor for flagellar operon FliA
VEFSRVMSAEEQSQWARFRSCPCDPCRSKMIEFYRSLVDIVLRSFRNVRAEDRKDLQGAGYYGLIKAVDEWDERRMIWLDFAKLKIRYAMVDQVREVSWVPKGVRQRARKIEEVEEELTSRLGREPTVKELSERLGISEEDCEQQISSFRATDWSVTSLEGRGDMEATWYETLEDPGAPDPQTCSLWAEQMDDLELVLQRLPAQDRLLIRWKYFHFPRVPQKWMATQLGVHESRVSQLLDSAIDRARKIAEHPYVLFPELYQTDERFTSRD